MDEQKIYQVAARVVEMVHIEFGEAQPGSCFMALAGAMLMIARESGVQDAQLLTAFASFVEDNR